MGSNFFPGRGICVDHRFQDIPYMLLAICPGPILSETTTQKWETADGPREKRSKRRLVTSPRYIFLC